MECTCRDDRDACSNCDEPVNLCSGVTSSITMQLPSAWTVPTPAPCPSCGHCPTCGRGHQALPGYYPIPWSPNIYPQITYTVPNVIWGINTSNNIGVT